MHMGTIQQPSSLEPLHNSHRTPRLNMMASFSKRMLGHKSVVDMRYDKEGAHSVSGTSSVATLGCLQD
eukprot:5735407-Amphidinium_carterae.1